MQAAFVGVKLLEISLLLLVVLLLVDVFRSDETTAVNELTAFDMIIYIEKNVTIFLNES